jgi:hypothetical protein
LSCPLIKLSLCYLVHDLVVFDHFSLTFCLICLFQKLEYSLNFNVGIVAVNLNDLFFRRSFPSHLHYLVQNVLFNMFYRIP